MPSSITLPQYSITIPDIPESQWPQTLSSLYGMPSPLEVAAINETVGAAESSILKIQSSILETKQQMSRLEILLRELSDRDSGGWSSCFNLPPQSTHGTHTPSSRRDPHSDIQGMCRLENSGPQTTKRAFVYSAGLSSVAIYSAPHSDFMVKNQSCSRHNMAKMHMDSFVKQRIPP